MHNSDEEIEEALTHLLGAYPIDRIKREIGNLVTSHEWIIKTKIERVNKMLGFMIKLEIKSGGFNFMYELSGNIMKIIIIYDNGYEETISIGI